MIRVLWIDDDEHAQTVLPLVLPREIRILPCMTGEMGIRMAREEYPDVVLLDVDLPDMDGFDVLREIASDPFAPPVIMLTGLSNTGNIVRAIRSGAQDYILKPYRVEELLLAIGRAASMHLLAESSGNDSLSGRLLGESRAIRNVRRMISLFAPVNLPVLILGDSGTGKEVTARALHDLSSRREGPFEAINSGAIPDALIESELLGSVRGAFTGAVEKAGSFERADGGTLFLDEIGEMHVSAQVKLLRVLEEGALVRLGGTRRVAVNVRVISATNRNLGEAMNRGSFRNDLYYRISALVVPLPPLCERKEDIPILSISYLAAQAGAEGRPEAPQIRPGALEKLQDHNWPGNVRELRNVLSRARILAAGNAIGPEHVQFDAL